MRVKYARKANQESRRLQFTPSATARGNRDHRRYHAARATVQKVLLNQSETKFKNHTYSLGVLNHNTITAVPFWKDITNQCPSVGDIDTEHDRDDTICDTINGNEIIRRGDVVCGMSNIAYDKARRIH